MHSGESEKTPSLYPSLSPDTLVETAGEKPTVIQNPTEDRQGKKSYNESAEIQSIICHSLCMFT